MSVLAFGKADFTLGVHLPKAGGEVLRPKRIDSLEGADIVELAASRYHSLAVTKQGAAFSWGLGKGGRLGLGDEATIPEPTLIRELLHVKISKISVSENHSMALTSMGDIYTWGSNRFGQLGHGDSDKADAAASQHMVPRKVKSLAKLVVVGIAAGSTHSTCFTNDGEVYAWGSNKNGQLGLKTTEVVNMTGAGPGVSTPKRLTSVQKVISAIGSVDDEGASLGCPIIQLSVSQFSTLMLCRPREQPTWTRDDKRLVNEVYQWGFGSWQPTKVNFSANSASVSSSGVGGGGLVGNGKSSAKGDARISQLESIFASSSPVNITQVAAGPHHNAAISSAAHVYCWGLATDQLGLSPEMLSDRSAQLTRPQLVESLLPEYGGGRAVFVTVCSNRTCVVSDRGDLYTWGSTDEKGILGHGSGKFQPVPKRVVGVKRAIAVAVGDEHTLVLQSANVPTLPHALAYIPVKTKSKAKSSLMTVEEPEEDLETQAARLARSGFLDESLETELNDSFEHSSDDEYDERTRSPDYVLMRRRNRPRGSSFDIPKSSDSRRQFDSKKGLKPTSDMIMPDSTMPSMSTLLSLKGLCEHQLAQGITLKNSVQMLAAAERYQCPSLATFCASFIQKNLDAVLVQSKPHDFDVLLEGSFTNLRKNSITEEGRAEGRRLSFDFTDDRSVQRPRESSVDETLPKRDRAYSKDLESSDAVVKLIRSIKKKLSAIESIEEKERCDVAFVKTQEQVEKIGRKNFLLSELKRLNLILARLQGQERIQEQARQVREKALTGKEPEPAPICPEKSTEKTFETLVDEDVIKLVEGDLGYLAPPSRDSLYTGTVSAASEKSHSRKKKSSHGVSNSAAPATVAMAAATGAPPPSFAMWEQMIGPTSKSAHDALSVEQQRSSLSVDSVNVGRPTKVSSTSPTMAMPESSMTPKKPSPWGAVASASQAPSGSLRDIINAQDSAKAKEKEKEMKKCHSWATATPAKKLVNEGEKKLSELAQRVPSPTKIWKGPTEPLNRTPQAVAGVAAPSISSMASSGRTVLSPPPVVGGAQYMYGKSAGTSVGNVGKLAQSHASTPLNGKPTPVAVKTPGVPSPAPMAPTAMADEQTSSRSTFSLADFLPKTQKAAALIDEPVSAAKACPWKTPSKSCDNLDALAKDAATMSTDRSLARIDSSNGGSGLSTRRTSLADILREEEIAAQNAPKSTTKEFHCAWGYTGASGASKSVKSSVVAVQQEELEAARERERQIALQKEEQRLKEEKRRKKEAEKQKHLAKQKERQRKEQLQLLNEDEDERTGSSAHASGQRRPPRSQSQSQNPRNGGGKGHRRDHGTGTGNGNGSGSENDRGGGGGGGGRENMGDQQEVGTGSPTAPAARESGPRARTQKKKKNDNSKVPTQDSGDNCNTRKKKKGSTDGSPREKANAL
jgi:alpha-tubulin suppressor-like RCC1 family protein